MMIYSVLPIILSFLISFFSLGGSNFLPDLVNRSLEEEYIQESVITLEVGDALVSALAQEAEESLVNSEGLSSVPGKIVLSTKNVSNVKDLTAYSEGIFSVGDNGIFNFATAVTKDGILVDKNAIRDISNLAQGIVTSARQDVLKNETVLEEDSLQAFDLVKLPNLSPYYDFEEENIFIPFSSLEKEEIDGSKEKLGQIADEVFDSLVENFDIEKFKEFISNCGDSMVAFNEDGSVIVSGSIISFLDLFESMVDFVESDDNSEVVGPIKESIESIKKNESAYNILEASTFTLSYSNSKDKYNFDFTFTLSIPSSLILSSVNEDEVKVPEFLAASENIEIFSISFSNSYSFEKEEVEEMKRRGEEFRGKSKREILYCQAREGYELAETATTKSFSCYYYGEDVVSGMPIELDASAEYVTPAECQDVTYNDVAYIDFVGMNGYLIEDRMYLPMRAICESMGYDVCWDPTEGKAYASTGDDEVYMEGKLINGRTYVKVRDFEKLGFVVSFNSTKEDCLDPNGNPVFKSLCCVGLTTSELEN